MFRLFSQATDLLKVKRRNFRRKAFIRNHLPEGAVGAEIGVYKGEFSDILLKTVKPKELHLIDPWYLLGASWSWGIGSRSTVKALRKVLARFPRELSDGKVKLHIGYDQDILPDFPDEYFDWVYLDTLHTYDQAQEELRLLARKVKKSGVIAGDDWQSDPAHPHHGVCRAVREFCDKRGFRVVYAQDEDKQWAIKCQRNEV